MGKRKPGRAGGPTRALGAGGASWGCLAKDGSLNNRHELSCCPGGQESEIDVLAGLVPSWGLRGGVCSGPCLASGGVLATPGVPRLLKSPSNLCFQPVWVQISPSHNDAVMLD